MIKIAHTYIYLESLKERLYICRFQYSGFKINIYIYNFKVKILSLGYQNLPSYRFE